MVIEEKLGEHRRETAIRIRVTGVVQGVGFRPFVYRLAKGLDLRGYVVNLGGSGVEIHLEGSRDSIKKFLDKLRAEAPPQARLNEIEVNYVEPRGYGDFEIKESVGDVVCRSVIPPDLSICKHCVEEIVDPKGRFYGYHWNSCAWCGPRFSMIYRIPYDRDNTAMKIFPLCDECRRDYGDPNNVRRFHAQGVSCPKCGPKTFIYTRSGVKLNVENPVEFVADRILEGAIIAIKGVGGFHIACLASDDEVVAKLRVRKNRPCKPFALMARDLGIVGEIAELTPGSRELLESPQRPIVILPKRGSRVSELVAPGLSTIGVMLPYTGFQVLLLNSIPDGFLIMTSGNKHGKPMCRDLDCVFSELSNIVDYVVDHERTIVHRVDDSVIRFTDGEPVLLRRGRGYAPEWIEVNVNLVESVAVGAELQTAGAVGFGNKVVLTQFIGDIDEPDTLGDLEKELYWFIETYGVKPRVVALDKHPLYHNRVIAKRLAENYGAELVEVQHHHAHAVSLMGEIGADLNEEFVAITIDGTGYGDDGGIWGGEILRVSYRGYVRVGCLKPFNLPGGDSASTYPVKPLISLLASMNWGEGEVLSFLEKRGVLNALPYGVDEAALTYSLAKEGRGVVTTSMGRTLDAFSALLGLCVLRTYEGEPPMKLEAAADGGSEPLDHEPKVTFSDGRFIVETTDTLSFVINHLDSVNAETLALTTLYALGRALGKVALSTAKGLRRVSEKILVSGGAAVNTYVVRGIRDAVSEGGLKVVLPKKLPAGDGGLALGQIIVASTRAELYV